jgi:hypothetical protein
MVRFLKSALIVLIIVSALAAGLWFLGLHIVEQRDAAALEDIKKLKHALQMHHAKTGTYPSRIDDIAKPLKIGAEKIMLVVPRPRILYFTEPDGYRLQYYHWPFGPFLGYDSRTDDWYCEE